jgi:5-methylcytosine-specific restriction endonuclease McrA
MRKGQKTRPETKEKLRKIGLLRRASAETKRKMSESHKGRIFSPETRAKISKVHLGMKQSEASKIKIREKRALQVITPKMLEGLKKGRGVNSSNYKDGRMKNPEYVSWLKNQWHHRKRNALGSHSFAEWETLKAQYDYTCPCCHKREPEIKLSCDHIIPLSKGGSNNIENLQPLCRLCNSIKNNKTIKY